MCLSFHNQSSLPPRNLLRTNQEFGYFFPRIFIKFKVRYERHNERRKHVIFRVIQPVNFKYLKPKSVLKSTLLTHKLFRTHSFSRSSSLNSRFSIGSTLATHSIALGDIFLSTCVPLSPYHNGRRDCEAGI